MIVKFENSQGIEREIGRASDENAAHDIITEFLNDHKYHSYYRRTWYPEDNHEKVDVGSHTEFFHIYLEDGEEWK